MPSAAYAQSTGSVEFEEESTIVVTGSATQDVAGIQVPDAPKAKAVLTQEMISRSSPGQTVLDALNIVPGVSFQNNDAYGNAGGTLSVRGFDSTRVSYTLDGIQLNDSGNYSIYSNFSIDPELIEQVNVALGSTDVDSPTASAVGGTINQRTRDPGKEFGGRFVGTVGDFSYRRLFGMIDTGTLTSFGTRAFVAGSVSKYNNPFNNYGKMDRKQLNAKIYQPIGSDGDFVSIAGRYNRDRNNFFGSVQLRNDRAVPSGFPQEADDRFYDVAECTIDTPQNGVIDSANSCATEFDRRYNPSNSFNIRGNSRFTLAEGLVLTIDPSFQYTKANGGGTVLGREGVRTIGGVDYTGFIGGQYYFGRDLNGDGDTLDTCSTTGGSCSSSNLNGVRLLAPSQTHTERYAAIAGLRYEIDPNNTVRFAYTIDHANHRQTGQLTGLQKDGEPNDVFAIDDPIEDANGNVVQKRDRQSYAVLNQIAGEYRGVFGPLTVNAGVRVPFFKRDLENYCFTTSASGFVDCFGGDEDLEQDYDDATTFQGPQRRVLKYSKVLPNIGVIYDFTPQISAFASYSKGLSVPSTDNLYNAFFFPADTDAAKPKPETTDTFDGGVRYRSSKIQAQLSAWHTNFKNRIADAYDAELDQKIFRNLGAVEKYGIDASIAYQPIREVSLYLFGSLNKSEIKEDLEIADGVFTNTKGKREAGSPKYNYGASFTAEPFANLRIGATAKRTGPRFIYDNNEAVYVGDTTSPTAGNEVREVFAATTDAYWLVNADVRYDLAAVGLDKTYVQMNVYNLFDQVYAGGFGGFSNQPISSSGFYTDSSSGIPFVQMGAPRTVSLSLNVGF